MKYELLNKRDKNLSLLLQVLKNREIKDVEHYLHVSDNDILDPDLLEGMAEGVEMFVKNADSEKDTFLVVDADCDGMTSAAIIYNYARRIWPDWVDNHWKYFLHDGKKHGLKDCIDLAIKREFVIAPDSSSNDYEEMAKLKELGIDVLILDHHQAPYRSEDSITINNQFEYPNHTLSGAGVVYKFCQKLDEKLQANIADDFLDLAACGIVADVMSLKEFETHRIVQRGLNNINNPMLITIIDKNEYSLRGHINPKGVSWNVSPLINAVTRVGTVEENIMFFEGFLENKAYTLVPSGKRGHKGEDAFLVEEAVRIASNIRSRQNKIRDKRLEEVCDIIEKEQLYKNKIIIVCQEDLGDDEKGITGLIANQLASKYKHPVLLLSRGEYEGEITYSGSGRNPSNSELEDFRQFIEDSQLAIHSTGHEAAFGTSFTLNNLNKFIQYSNDKLTNYSFDSIYKVDDILTPSTIDLNDILSIYQNKDLWGKDLVEPLIAIKDIKINKNNVFINEKILKITVGDLECIKFKPTESEWMFFSSLSGVSTMEIVGTCDYSDYNKLPQLMIKDYNIKKEEFWDF